MVEHTTENRSVGSSILPLATTSTLLLFESLHASRAKDTVRALLDRLPDDFSLDDVLYHLYVVHEEVIEYIARDSRDRALQLLQQALETSSTF